MYVIYCHRNKINGKKYIGQTKFGEDLSRRFGENGKNYRNHPLFGPAIEKYGWDNFEHIILEKVNTYKEALNLETMYTRKFKTNDPKYGYNLPGSNRKNIVKNRIGINKELTNKFVKPEELQDYLDNGWKKGLVKYKDLEEYYDYNRKNNA